MNVPEFWPAGRIQRKTAERQITVRRYGCSDISLEDAQHQADQRAREAFDRIVSGGKLPRRERHPDTAQLAVIGNEKKSLIV
jgi:hypothetical protein